MSDSLRQFLYEWQYVFYALGVVGVIVLIWLALSD